MEIQCKSCGSVRFKQIKYRLYECEYCGRILEPDNIAANTSIESIKIDPLIGKIILDPTRTLQFKITKL